MWCCGAGPAGISNPAESVQFTFVIAVTGGGGGGNYARRVGRKSVRVVVVVVEVGHLAQVLVNEAKFAHKFGLVDDSVTVGIEDRKDDVGLRLQPLLDQREPLVHRRLLLGFKPALHALNTSTKRRQ